MFDDGTNKVIYTPSIKVALKTLTLEDVNKGIAKIEEHNYELETIND